MRTMPRIIKSHPRIDITVRIEKYQFTCLNLISASSALFLSGWSCNDSFLYALLISEEPLACEINFSTMKSVLIISHSYKRTPIILTHQTTHIDSLLMLWLYFQTIPLSSYRWEDERHSHSQWILQQISLIGLYLPLIVSIFPPITQGGIVST